MLTTISFVITSLSCLLAGFWYFATRKPNNYPPGSPLRTLQNFVSFVCIFSIAICRSQMAADSRKLIGIAKDVETIEWRYVCVR